MITNGLARSRVRRWSMVAIASAAVWFGSNAAAVEVAGTVSEVMGDVVVIRAAQPVRIGDAVQILVRIPGFDEPGLVGSGRVTGVSPGRITAAIAERNGALAVGQIARIASAAAAAPLAASTRSPSAAAAAAPPGAVDTPAATSGQPATGSATPGVVEGELNQALQEARLSGVTASIGAGFVVTLRGTVSNAADKQRAFQIARSFREAVQIKDQVFVVEQ